MAETKAELKKCMCGGEAKVLHAGLQFWVYCTKSQCFTGPIRKTEAEAITAWNTRPLEDALAGALEKIRYDLAIIYEHTNLQDCEENPKENWVEAVKMIRTRTEKYENLKLTAGPLSGECPPKIAKRIKQALEKYGVKKCPMTLKTE